MAGLVPAIHVLFLGKDVDARHKAGHDKWKDHAPVNGQRRAQKETGPPRQAAPSLRPPENFQITITLVPTFTRS
jgi:hypothetical protein